MGKDDVREVSNKETKSLFGMIFQVLKSFFLLKSTFFEHIESLSFERISISYISICAHKVFLNRMRLENPENQSSLMLRMCPEVLR